MSQWSLQLLSPAILTISDKEDTNGLQIMNIVIENIEQFVLNLTESLLKILPICPLFYSSSLDMQDSWNLNLRLIKFLSGLFLVSFIIMCLGTKIYPFLFLIHSNVIIIFVLSNCFKMEEHWLLEGKPAPYQYGI